jgi:hypothetical protein
MMSNVMRRYEAAKRYVAATCGDFEATPEYFAKVAAMYKATKGFYLLDLGNYNAYIEHHLANETHSNAILIWMVHVLYDLKEGNDE